MSSRVLLWMAVSCVALSVCAANEEAETCRPTARFVEAPWWTSRLAQTRSRILRRRDAECAIEDLRRQMKVKIGDKE